MTFKFPEQYRLRKGKYASSLEEHGLNGAGFIPLPPPERSPLKFIASNGDGMVLEHRWEHVSLSLPYRCPTWAEMCRAKALFWDDEDAVMQLHPPQSTWVNNHRYCLHLWRPVNGMLIPLPPEFLVGDRERGVLT